MTPEQPSGRRLAGAFAIIAWIALWAVFVASLTAFVGKWPVLVQAPFYLIVGLVWIFPLKPLIRWSQTGRWNG